MFSLKKQQQIASTTLTLKEAFVQPVRKLEDILIQDGDRSHPVPDVTSAQHVYNNKKHDPHNSVY